MATIRVPYLKLRNGRPRWEPGPKLRQRGYKGQDLKNDAGEWLSLEDAISAAKKLNEQTKNHTRPPRRQTHKTTRTCTALWEKYAGLPDDPKTQSMKYRKLAPKTQKDYRDKIRPFLASKFGQAPVTAVTKPALFGYYEHAQRQHGHAMANGIIAVVRRMFSYGELIGWIPARSNPAYALSIDAISPRLSIWLPQQVQTFVEIADELDGGRFSSVADAFVIAIHSAQRLSDVLSMPPAMFSNGRIQLSQMKRDALIDVKMTPQVHARIEQIRARHARRDVVSVEAIIISEVTGRPYIGTHTRSLSHFNDRFRKVRAAAAKKLPRVDTQNNWSGRAAIREISELTFSDTRDTAVTRLAMAGNDANHIAAVSGHSQQSIHLIMKHYLALNRAMADTATDRVVAWLEREGIAI